MKKVLLFSLLFVCLGAFGAFAEDGHEVVKANCSLCHGLDVVESGFGVKDEAAWIVTVDRMLDKDGAPTVTPSQYNAMIQWLAAQKK